MTDSTATPRPTAAVDKIKRRADFDPIAARLHAAGTRIALAHGVFDLLHMGHVRHLEEARGHGDCLIVSITPDRFVNKGPGRPVFEELMRAEMLAAMSSVDWVVINDEPTAEAMIETVKPQAYIKGPDYVRAEDDVSGKINVERALVEQYGGQIVFTDDITFSSSELINRHFSPFAPDVRTFIDGMRDAGQKQPLLDLLDRAEGLRVLVVGETVIDEYRYVQPMNKTPKENLVATLYNSAEVFAGGAVATANHVAALCREVDLLTLVGHDAEGASIQQRVKGNVTVYPVERAMAPTVRKVRYVDSNQMRKMFEIYHMDDQPLAAGTQAKVDDFIRAKAADYDLVIVNDFGHGMIAASTVAALTEASRFLAVNTQTNSGNFGFNLISKFTGADYVCIDTPEARLATGQKYGAVDSLLTRHLAKMMPTAKIVITQGRDGCLAYAAGAAPHQVPALADKVVDTVGAGDAFLAITAPLVAAGGDMRQVGFLGNIAGALKVGIVGHRQSIDKVALIKAVVAMLK